MEITTTPVRRTRRLAGLLVNLLCVLISLLGLLFLLPAAFGLERYVIAGGSMTGSISRGSVVFEERVPVSDLRVGDVITYLPPAESGIPNLVTHRIHTIEADVFRTKGDANPDPDPWTFKLEATTQPRVVTHVPVVGYLFIALQDRTTRMAVIGVPALLVALGSLFQLLGVRRPRPAAAPVPAAPVAVPAPSGPSVRIPAQPLAASAGRRTTRRGTRRDQRRHAEVGR